MNRGWIEMGLSLGSNLGDRLDALRRARRAIGTLAGAREAARSSIYETEPVGVRPEHRHRTYYNAVLIVETDRPCEDWLDDLNRIEAGLGRKRGGDRNEPRTLDIDILYYDDRTIDGGGLTVPHPRWMDRRFVVEPLAEVRPDLRLPGSDRTVRAVRDALRDDKRVQRLDIEW